MSHVDPVTGEPYEQLKPSKDGNPAPSADVAPAARPAPQLGEEMDAETSARVLRRLRLVLSTMAVVLGLATIVVTLAAGGGATARGILLGGVLALMGGARLYLTLRHNA